VDSFQKNVIAWSRLATVGARPAAESAGINREFYARVLNGRRVLPEAETKALAKVLGLTGAGFEPQKIQANLCRNLDDLDAVVAMGFEATYFAQIKTEKEMRGGSSLQKYVAIYFSYRGVGRISIMRMATENWLKLEAKLGKALPILEVETLTIPFFNSIDRTSPADIWDGLVSQWRKKNLREMSSLLKIEVNKFLLDQDEIKNKSNFARRLIRKTYLGRVTEKNSSITEWPEGAKLLAASRVLIPLTNDFLPARAAGIRADKKRVFIYLATIKEDEILELTPDLLQQVEHALVFLIKPWDSKEKFELFFDGPIESLMKNEIQNQNGKESSSFVKKDATAIYFCNKVVPSEMRLIERDR
jgi:hypothetical protein